MFFKAGIKKKLYDFVLDLCIEMKEREYTVILGPSGAGKSMTLRIIAGIESCQSQKITMDGKDISTFPPERRNIAYLPQKDSLFPHMSVFENIMFPFYANGREIDKDLVDRVIDTFRIESILKRMPRHLSGGEARRAALARAICARPKLLLLDEPLTSLDFYTKLELIEFLKRLADEYKITILHVTHDPIETYMLAQSLYFIKGGRIIFKKAVFHKSDRFSDLDRDTINYVLKRLLHVSEGQLF